MFTIDQAFPDFSLEVYQVGAKQEGRFSLADFKQLASDAQYRFLVLLFYPADFTYICPTELADLQKHVEDFKKYNAHVVVVSTDTVYTHKGWLDAEQLLHNFSFDMAADHNGALSRALGIYGEQRGLAQRATFIIDASGILRAVDIVSDDIGRSASELVRRLKALSFVKANPGKVCPASWDEGDSTITPSIAIAGKVKEGMGG